MSTAPCQSVRLSNQVADSCIVESVSNVLVSPVRVKPNGGPTVQFGSSVTAAVVTIGSSAAGTMRDASVKRSGGNAGISSESVSVVGVVRGTGVTVTVTSVVTTTSEKLSDSVAVWLEVVGKMVTVVPKLEISGLEAKAGCELALLDKLVVLPTLKLEDAGIAVVSAVGLTGGC